VRTVLLVSEGKLEPKYAAPAIAMDIPTIVMSLLESAGVACIIQKGHSVIDAEVASMEMLEGALQMIAELVLAH